MNNSTLVLKSIDELKTCNFFIPAYQRGYRWNESQVTDLLRDIDGFFPERIENSEESTFYCLQPIVLKKCDTELLTKNKLDGDWYEVIDGQQRLTTIYLINHYANEMWKGKQKNIEFQLKFETREISVDFLKKLEVNNEIGQVKIDNSNIDFHHISEAYNSIHKWVVNYGRKFDEDIFQSKFNKNSKVIWYEVDKNINSIDIFTRINIGKIPLTNAELIRASILKKDNFETQHTLKQIQIATEWETIEKRLQEDSFWHFIFPSHKEKIYENRIEYIFDLMYGKDYSHEEFYTLNKFLEESNTTRRENGKIDVEALWLKIKRYFMTLDEWYNDRELYHILGFLIECNKRIKINELIQRSNIESKLEFKDSLDQEIKAVLKGIDIEDLEYQRHKDKIRQVLLLFNIQTILNTTEADMRFPFDKFKSENWDIEHINSQTDATMAVKDKKMWALDLLEFHTGLKGFPLFLDSFEEDQQLEQQAEYVKNKMTDVDKQKICFDLLKILESEKQDDDMFKSTYNKVIDIYIKEKEGYFDGDGLSNLALLDDKTNRSYRNAMFFIKRKKIVDNDKSGIFVPICTKNVFLKYYSKTSDNNLYWEKSDSNDYINSIKNSLASYLKTSDNE